ncbi:leucine-rich repeat protein [Ruminococcus albus]|uniref:Leucine rich repeat-containing protein n=1 Tax=Ruminococcus albus TaxID=1264 RepID=A0A1I1D709_RUMAL|nr:leucine-rich repeat protein [Ruminococcus albus]SFB70731.1 Leucine rich repeat-containing protein [Ruminococcus albus]
MKSKKILAGLMALTFVLGGAAMPANTIVDTVLTASAEETFGDYTYKLLDDGTVEITNYNGNDENVVTPANIDGIPVTSIGELSFKECTNLKSVKISEGVTNIGRYAFANCTYLKDVTLPDSLERIGIDPFVNTEIESEQNNNGDYMIIDGWVIITLFDIENESLTIPDGVVGIADMTMMHGEIHLPDSLKYVGKGAFSDALSTEHRVYDTLEIPENVIKIYDVGFMYRAKSLVLHEGLEYIGKGAFLYITAKEITVPSSVTYIGESALGYNGKGEKIDGFTISGYTGTAAEKYAKDNGFEFISLGEVPPAKDTVKGDLNGDGVVNVTDLTKLAAHIKGKKLL